MFRLAARKLPFALRLAMIDGVNILGVTSGHGVQGTEHSE